MYPNNQNNDQDSSSQNDRFQRQSSYSYRGVRARLSLKNDSLASIPQQQMYPVTQPGAYMNTAYGQPATYNGYNPQSFSTDSEGFWRKITRLFMRRSFVIGFAAMAMMFAGGFGLFAILQKNPTDLFYASLDKQMQLRSVHVIRELTAPAINVKTRLDYYANLADPLNPKTTGTLESSYNFLNKKSSVAAEFTTILPDVYVRMTQPKYDGWVLVTLSDETLLSQPKAVDLSRAWQLATTANSPLDVFISGNIDTDIRKRFIKNARENNVYTVVESSIEKEGEANMRKFTVNVNREEAAKLLKQLADDLGKPFSSFTDTGQSFEVWVDVKRQYITKIYQKSDTSNNTFIFSEQNDTFEFTQPEATITTNDFLTKLPANQ